MSVSAQDRQCECSGGERDCVRPLGEPSNPLEVETLSALEETTLDLPVCTVVISHDRCLLGRIARHMLGFEGDRAFVWFEGNCADCCADRRECLGEDTNKPHRIRYRALI